MKVVRLAIQNFRGIKSAELLFDGHTLMVGTNNVGKSTLCEALDLVLGPDRLNRLPPVDEFDFYNGEYLAPPAGDGAERTPIPLRIEAVLIEPGAEIDAKCGGNIEFWHVSEQRLLGTGEADAANPPHTVPCLRVETIAAYNPEEDEFEARTYFSRSPDAPPGELTKVPKAIKRLFGFLYLRALRTGSRALSLERGSLLDIILRTKGVRTTLWEKTIERLRGLDIEADATEIAPVLRSVERRLKRYIALESPGEATKLHVSELTREHLRKTMMFFLALSADQGHVPFAHAGTGTINTLVLALLIRYEAHVEAGANAARTQPARFVLAVHIRRTERLGGGGLGGGGPNCSRGTGGYEARASLGLACLRFVGPTRPVGRRPTRAFEARRRPGPRPHRAERIHR